MNGPIEEERQVYSISLNGELARRLEAAGARAAMAPEALLEQALKQYLTTEGPGDRRLPVRPRRCHDERHIQGNGHNR